MLKSSVNENYAVNCVTSVVLKENEISELNDMLTEAGETFEQRESELQKLKDLVQEYEKKLETQVTSRNSLLTESIGRGVEIVKFSTCPGTSKWP